MNNHFEQHEILVQMKIRNETSEVLAKLATPMMQWQVHNKWTSYMSGLNCKLQFEVAGDFFFFFLGLIREAGEFIMKWEDSV